MKYVICSIRDSAADVFGIPMFFQSKGAAIRAFSDECNRVAENNNLNKHPKDFEMFQVGIYDDAQAEFDCNHPPLALIRATDCIIKKD